MVKLYLDDLRPIPKGFVGVRSYSEYVIFITQSGFDCAKWLVNYCLDNGKPIPKFVVHSQNPVGKQNIESLLNNFNKIRG